MLKTINVLLVLILLSACSSQEKQEDKETNDRQIVIEKDIKKAEIKIPDVETIKTENSTSKALFTLTTLEGKTLHVNEVAGGPMLYNAGHIISTELEIFDAGSILDTDTEYIDLGYIRE